jgi:hypothetical protein
MAIKLSVRWELLVIVVNKGFKIEKKAMAPPRLELGTLALLAPRSNQLSYKASLRACDSRCYHRKVCAGSNCVWLEFPKHYINTYESQCSQAVPTGRSWTHGQSRTFLNHGSVSVAGRTPDTGGTSKSPGRYLVSKDELC